MVYMVYMYINMTCFKTNIFNTEKENIKTALSRHVLQLYNLKNINNGITIKNVL